jgi:hypothetical protein
MARHSHRLYAVGFDYAELMGIVFGATANMPVATAVTVFLYLEGLRWKIGPSTKYVSVVSVSGGYRCNLLLEGQTDVTT